MSSKLIRRYSTGVRNTLSVVPNVYEKLTSDSELHPSTQ